MAQKYGTTANLDPDTGEDDNRSKHEFWRKWVDLAQKAARNHHRSATLGWNEYENKRDGVSSNHLRPLQDLRDSYPIYWSAVKTLEPAFYSRTPKLSSKRRFGIQDDVAATASLIAERLGDYHTENSNFDACMMGAVGDFIHADKATVQLKYDVEMEQERVQVVPTDESLEEFVNAAGEVVDEEIFQLPDGTYFYRGPEMVPVDGSQSIKLVPCAFDEVLHTPDARTEEEILDKAYKFHMTKAEALKRFEVDPDMVQWKRVKDESEDDETRRETPIETTEWYLEGYECWCKVSRKVYWYSDQYPELLDIRDDPYELRGFFPSPNYIIGSKPSKSLFPTPVYLQLYPQIRELHRIAERIPVLIDSARRRAIVDGDEDVIAALNSLDDVEFIAAKGFKSILEKGGLQNLVHYIPVKDVVDCISELNAITQKFKEEFNEFFGLPAILRGIADPQDAAETNRRLAAAGNDRFRFMKKQLRMLARDAIEMMVDLSLRVYSDEMIAKIAGYQWMPPADQQRFAAALELLRSDDARVVRLQIETDSMAFVDEQAEAAKMERVSAMVTQGIQAVAQIIQIDPGLAIVPLNVMLMSLENVNPGRAVMDDIRSQIGNMIADAKKAKESPPPPPPDYEMLRVQVLQQEAQAKLMAVQLKGQVEGAKLERKDFENQLALQKQYADEAVQRADVQLEQYGLQLESQKLALEQVTQQFMMQVEGMRVQIEQFKAQGEMQERQMEEFRLARQVDNEYQVGMAEAMRPPEQAAPAAPPIINVNSPTISPVNVGAPEPAPLLVPDPFDPLGGI